MRHLDRHIHRWSLGVCAFLPVFLSGQRFKTTPRSLKFLTIPISGHDFCKPGRGQICGGSRNSLRARGHEAKPSCGGVKSYRLLGRKTLFPALRQIGRYLVDGAETTTQKLRARQVSAVWGTVTIPSLHPGSIPGASTKPLSFLKMGATSMRFVVSVVPTFPRKVEPCAKMN